MLCAASEQCSIGIIPQKFDYRFYEGDFWAYSAEIQPVFPFSYSILYHSPVLSSSMKAYFLPGVTLAISGEVFKASSLTLKNPVPVSWISTIVCVGSSWSFADSEASSSLGLVDSSSARKTTIVNL